MNKYYRSGIMTLMLVGGYFLYRNRAQVQQFLESKGIKTPLDTSGSLTDSIKSGIAKISGRTEYAADSMGKDSRQAI